MIPYRSPPMKASYEAFAIWSHTCIIFGYLAAKYTHVTPYPFLGLMLGYGFAFFWKRRHAPRPHL